MANMKSEKKSIRIVGYTKSNGGRDKYHCHSTPGKK